jgi:hypothetical protein
MAYEHLPTLNPPQPLVEHPKARPLVAFVLERGYEAHRLHQWAQGLTIDEFTDELLDTLAAWQRARRTGWTETPVFTNARQQHLYAFLREHPTPAAAPAAPVSPPRPLYHFQMPTR